MSDNKSAKPAVEPKDAHAGSGKGEVTTKDIHATGGDLTTKDIHATGGEATVTDIHATGEPA
ncbi:hypothetical protein [Streptomyces sp. NPDC051569]|uniref:hypothetical protein n=1 Tax=Streptomyces sp. NPDC051569 TaxID=3365661 RepID=UPI0037ADBAF0